MLQASYLIAIIANLLPFLTLLAVILGLFFAMKRAGRLPQGLIPSTGIPSIRTKTASPPKAMPRHIARKLKAIPHTPLPLYPVTLSVTRTPPAANPQENTPQPLPASQPSPAPQRAPASPPLSDHAHTMMERLRQSGKT